jgi:hypothetical protein
MVTGVSVTGLVSVPAGRKGVRVKLGPGICRLLFPVLWKDEQADKTIYNKDKQTSNSLFRIGFLVLHLHFPNGLQQWPALLEARFTQIAQAEIDPLPAAAEKAGHQLPEGLLAGSQVIRIVPLPARPP